MVDTEMNKTYDEIYLELWEIAQRYCYFVNFRVIGVSHDERMIPMIEIGKGEKTLFCVSGIKGNEVLCVQLLMKMIKDYCNFYEKRWEINHLYNVKDLLDRIKLCVIPVINTDGYEIYQRGFLSIRNPVLRQMLRMQDIPHKEYEGNARNTKLRENFPLIEDLFEAVEEDSCGQKYWIENETRALINIFKEYNHAGLLYFSRSYGKIIRYEPQSKWCFTGRNRRINSHFKQIMGYRMESEKIGNTNNYPYNKTKGDCGQYYARFIRKTAFRIDIPIDYDKCNENDEKMLPCYETLRTIPLEFIFSI